MNVAILQEELQDVIKWQYQSLSNTLPLCMMLAVERSKQRAANSAGRDRTVPTWDSVLWMGAYCNCINIFWH